MNDIFVFSFMVTIEDGKVYTQILKGTIMKTQKADRDVCITVKHIAVYIHMLLLKYIITVWGGESVTYFNLG